VLAEIATEKINLELVDHPGGLIEKILVPAGEPVAVGTPIVRFAAAAPSTSNTGSKVDGDSPRGGAEGDGRVARADADSGAAPDTASTGGETDSSQVGSKTLGQAARGGNSAADAGGQSRGEAGPAARAEPAIRLREREKRHMTQTTHEQPTNGLRNQAVLNDPARNKGTAFTEEQRTEFGLHGFLPPNVETLDEQVARAYEAYQKKMTTWSGISTCAPVCTHY